MNTWCIAGLELTPAAFGDAHGNVTMVATADSPTSLERIARAAVVAMGASSRFRVPVDDRRRVPAGRGAGQHVARATESVRRCSPRAPRTGIPRPRRPPRIRRAGARRREDRRRRPADHRRLRPGERDAAHRRAATSWSSSRTSCWSRGRVSGRWRACRTSSASWNARPGPRSAPSTCATASGSSLLGIPAPDGAAQRGGARDRRSGRVRVHRSLRSAARAVRRRRAMLARGVEPAAQPVLEVAHRLLRDRGVRRELDSRGTRPDRRAAPSARPASHQPQRVLDVLVAEAVDRADRDERRRQPG